MQLPILGKVKAAEHTTQELERKLTTLLADGYLKRPQVTVTVAEFGSQKVFVTGEVQRPGQYALKADRTLLVLLSDIGPLSPNAGHEVLIVRPPAGGFAATTVGGGGQSATAATTPLGPEFPAEAGNVAATGEGKAANAATAIAKPPPARPRPRPRPRS